eukprot:4683598-Amphidinium_carterae.1
MDHWVQVAERSAAVSVQSTRFLRSHLDETSSLGCLSDSRRERQAGGLEAFVAALASLRYSYKPSKSSSYGKHTQRKHSSSESVKARVKLGAAGKMESAASGNSRAVA